MQTPPKDENDLVLFTVADKANPYNFPSWRKWMIVLIVGLNTLWAMMLSTIVVPATTRYREEFGIKEITSKVPIMTYLLGYSLGPVLIIPISEDYGRKPIGIASLLILYIFNIPQGLAQNVETLAVTRFIAGIFASPILNYVCLVPDLWRGGDKAGLWGVNFWAFMAESVVLGGIIGDYIVDRYDWRLAIWIPMAVGGFLLILFAVLVPETRPAPILTKRTKEIRKHHNPNAWTIYETKRSWEAIFKETLLRPPVMFFTEYVGINYGLIYLLIESMPLVYAEMGVDAPNSSLFYFAMEVGFVLALLCYHLQLKAQAWATRRSGEDKPEYKLFWGMLSAFVFPVSMYWYGGTGQPDYSVKSLSAGKRTTLTFTRTQVVSDYTIDSYQMLASSAVTGQSFCREILAATCALVTTTFYDWSYGVPGPYHHTYAVASYILAAIATLCIAIPFVFYAFGPRIRAASHYSLELKRLTKEEIEREKWMEERSQAITREQQHQHDAIETVQGDREETPAEKDTLEKVAEVP
ncbi:hypothetical protein E3P94_02806 [Wallemia ichthyophaga]|nr:hypothetical protein E3P98_02829 [Wallemia ichthyophaga]TIA98779.1 hypothetical protein E3P94_02806 [Wallemia ichthyophaga]